ncbi:ABC transporter permease [Streptomyces luteolifulvus]|jgi:ABC-2 type transport system permease protein|uniref:Transport permease protein n=1 Tax=Streptomyces luteolifulvus TaxID=2615112 RepID=A0A6H9V6L1_9ACTN|nr:ABC transporter permease [Streptomyces luteolifulvus]KAB1149167.1 ABC transporter permease [Streptomyces luteolifulvus]
MSTVTTTPAGRMAALARAELMLLGRSRTAVLSAVFLPLAMPLSLQSAVEQMDLKDIGLSVGLVLLPASIGFSLLFSVYATLVGVFTARREELVLKRLRTGELHDAEILAGAAFPAAAIGLVQSLVLAVGCTALLDVPAPKAPQLAVLGLVSGLALCACLAAVTAGFTRTVESAQVTSLPLILSSMTVSGVVVPLDLLPDRLATVCELQPLTGVITLVRGGWTGDLSAYETVVPVLTTLAWTAVGVFAVRRWFRWEPRR